MEQLKEVKQKGDRDKESLKKAIRAQKERAEKSEEYAEQLHVQLADKVWAVAELGDGQGQGLWMRGPGVCKQEKKETSHQGTEAREFEASPGYAGRLCHRRVGGGGWGHLWDTLALSALGMGVMVQGCSCHRWCWESGRGFWGPEARVRQMAAAI